MPAKQLTQVYLDAHQRLALQARARDKGTKVSEEIRAAVDSYLAGVTAEELALLDVASQRAEQDLAEMAQALDATNHKLDALFTELERSKAREKVTA